MKQVTIAIHGTQEVDGEQSVIDMMAEGTLSLTAGEMVLEYDEKDEDDRPVHTTLSVDREGIATLQREGSQRHRMTIQRGRRHLCHYDTPYGSLMIGVFGQQVAHTVTETGGEVLMRYTVDIDAVMQSCNEVKITVKEQATSCLN